MQNNLNTIFRALQYKNFRLFFYGQFWSMIGNWMHQVAIMWLVYRLTGSALLLGTVAFLSQIPALFFSPYAGILADHFPKKRLLYITQISYFFLALLFLLVFFFFSKNILAYLFLSFCLGIINAFDMPVRQAFFAELIDDKKDLPNAIALNSVVFHGSRLIGPSLAGPLIKHFGEWLCFLLNAFSYIPVFITLAYISYKHIPSGQKRASIISGFQYCFNNSTIRNLLTLVSLISFFGMNYTVMIPIFAKAHFHGDASLVGSMMSVAGIGAFSGALLLALRKDFASLPKQMILTALLLGSVLIAFAFSPALWFSFLLLPFIGFSMITQLGGSNIMMQHLVSHEFRGRVTSLYAVAFAGMIPLGNLLSGFMTEQIGYQYTMALFGAACVLTGLWYSKARPK